MSRFLNSCPEVYGTSPDFLALAGLVDSELETAEFYAERYTDLLSATHCPENLLPLLASQRGYNYHHGNPSWFNRVVLQHFNKDMIRNRGSKTGITWAAATELAALNHPKYGGDPLYYSALINVLSNVQEGVITILYFLGNSVDDDMEAEEWYTQKDENGLPIDQGLIEYVRPVGMYVDRVPAQLIEPNSYVGVIEKIEFRQEDYARLRRSILDPTSQVPGTPFQHQKNEGRPPLDSDNNNLNEAALPPDILAERDAIAAEAARVARPRAALYRMLLTKKPYGTKLLDIPDVYQVTGREDLTHPEGPIDTNPNTNVDHKKYLGTPGTTDGEGFLIYDDGKLLEYMQNPSKIPEEIAFLYDAIFPQEE